MASRDAELLELEQFPVLEAGEEDVALRGRRWRRWMQPTLMIGVFMLIVAVAVTICAPLISHHSPTDLSVDLLSGPSQSHFFGTDELGRDIFSRVVFASRVSLSVAFGAVGLAL